jgi:hypothetical protein
MIGFLPFSRGIGFDLVAAEIDWIDTLFRSANDSLWTLITIINQIWIFAIKFLAFYLELRNFKIHFPWESGWKIQTDQIKYKIQSEIAFSTLENQNLIRYTQ